MARSRKREQDKEGTSFSPPTPTPSRCDLPYNQLSCCKLLSLVAKQVCLGSVKGGTDFVQILLQKVEHLFNLSATHCSNFSQPATTLFVAEQFWRIHSGKRTKSLFKNKSRQVARFCCQFDHTLKNIKKKCIRVKVVFSVFFGVVTSFGKNKQQKSAIFLATLLQNKLKLKTTLRVARQDY